jgi:hypothetical protein
MRHVISLSSIPPRFGMIGPVLQGLVAQRSRPEAIELYIPRSFRRFPEWGGALPEVPEGITVVRVDEDLGPATKILPAVRARRGQAIDIFYVDDDRVYGRDTTRIALDIRKALPGAAICGAGHGLRERFGLEAPDLPAPQMVKLQKTPAVRAELQWRRLHSALRRVTGSGPHGRTPRKLVARSGYAEIACGYGGVLVRPDFFDDVAYAIPPVLWAVDDVWLSGMLARRGIPVWVDRRLYGSGEVRRIALTRPLLTAVIEGADRDKANRACIDYMRATYGIWGGATVGAP